MLTGTLVGLRAIEREDLPKLLEWRNRPKYRQYFREFRELSMDDQNRWYEKYVLADPNTIMFAIVELNTMRLLGACGLCYIDWVNKNADFSIYIGAHNLYIDDSFAPDAARVMAAYGFNELGMHRLWAEIYSFDTKKKEFFDALGFTRDGCHRETHWFDGQWHDSLYFGLLADDFQG